MIVRRVYPHVAFGTKAETLARLAPHVRESVIQPLLAFSVTEWHACADDVLDRITAPFSCPLIVRSSAASEDGVDASRAGEFRSVPEVPGHDRAALRRAVEVVIDSYGDAAGDHQVFVQPYVANVDMAGVILTRDLNTFAPYVTVNYDDRSGRPDMVTGGGGQPRTLVLFRGDCYQLADRRFIRVLAAVRELERLLRCDALDIEFACAGDTVHVFQVRRIALRGDAASAPGVEPIQAVLQHVYEHVTERSRPHPDLYGRATVYGVMPDWNPAEMIGIAPRPLALSLYRELITDGIWAYQRDNYGYKRLRSFPLMVTLAGHPYIDVRVDFNSFLPKGLPDELCHRLVDYYVDKLARQRWSHDKVEFDILFTCYTFDLDARLAELARHGFTPDDVARVRQALHGLTDRIIARDGLYQADLARLDVLEQRRRALLASGLPAVDTIYWLVEDCKRYGTLPFAGIARAAFIAVAFLDSLVTVGAVDAARRAAFLGSLNTVARRLGADLARMRAGALTRDAFLERYGHLRPGTYDIRVDRYDEQFELYFSAGEPPEAAPPVEPGPPFAWTGRELDRIQALLHEHALGLEAPEFVAFLREAIEGREDAKFLFTKSVSDVLRAIGRFGARLGLTADDLSFVEIGTFTRLYATVAGADVHRQLADEIERNRRAYAFHRFLRLPHLICVPEDVFAFHADGFAPNYVTAAVAEGPPVEVTPATGKEDVRGKIVCLPSADPGFDWIFAHDIRGLITMYGGVNSHMAIRAAEIGIASVIGCGPALFAEWSRAARLRIDGATQRVLVLAR